jgi:hypothetical protein
MIVVDGRERRMRIGQQVAYRQRWDADWLLGVVEWGGKSGQRIVPSGGGKVHRVVEVMVLP